MPGPQPVEGTKVTPEQAHRAAPLLQASGGEVPDRIFKFAMTVCGLAVLGILVLIVYELVSGSGLSWHAFGFKFFAGSDWNPVSEQLRRFALHLRDAGFVPVGAHHCSSACGRG